MDDIRQAFQLLVGPIFEQLDDISMHLPRPTVEQRPTPGEQSGISSHHGNNVMKSSTSTTETTTTAATATVVPVTTRKKWGWGFVGKRKRRGAEQGVSFDLVGLEELSWHSQEMIDFENGCP